MEKRTSVLIVEDEAIIAEDLRDQMERAGYEVVGVAASGEEALNLARVCAPELVFMDVNLRGAIDGVETACRMRKSVDAALVFTTAYSDATTLNRAKAAAPEGYLLKPYNRRELEATAAMAVEKRRLELELRRSHARLSAAVAACPDRILRVRRDGRLIEPGVDPRALADVIPAPALERVLACVRRCAEEARLVRVEYDERGVDGAERHIELRAAPVDLDECLLVLRDMTEQRDATLRASESMRMLHSLAQKLQAAREDERKDIARDLHDALGQHLVGLKMELVSCVALLPPRLPGGLRARFEALGAAADGVIEELRRITTKLRPLILDDLGLPAALQWLCEDFEKRARVRCQFQTAPSLDVESGRATTLFRVVQEALTNVARHAQAELVSVTLKADGGDIVLTVRDNGRGMDGVDTGSRSGHGLTTIRERAALWGGSSSLTSIPGKGTMLTVRLPARS